MNADDKSKLKAYEELIGSLEHTNGLQHRVIETQSSLIKSLEELKGEPIYAMATDTDGVDGNGEAAGAILRPDSMARAEELGLDPQQYLEEHNAELEKIIDDLTNI